MRELNERHLAARQFLTDRMNRSARDCWGRPERPTGPVSSSSWTWTASSIGDLRLPAHHGKRSARDLAPALHAYSMSSTRGGALRRYGGTVTPTVWPGSGGIRQRLHRHRRGNEHSLKPPTPPGRFGTFASWFGAFPASFATRITVTRSGPTLSRRRTAGLGAPEAQDLLSRHRLDRLTFIARSADTYFVAKGSNKGTGMAAALRLLGPGTTRSPRSEIRTMTAHVGDHRIFVRTRQLLHELATGRTGAETPHHVSAFQRGLLAAVRDLVRNHGTAPIRDRAKPEGLLRPNGLIARLLWVADESPFCSFLGRP